METHFALLSPFENRSYRKSHCSFRRGAGGRFFPFWSLDVVRRAGDHHQHRTRLHSAFPSRLLLNSFGVSREIPGRGRRTSIADLEHSYESGLEGLPGISHFVFCSVEPETSPQYTVVPATTLTLLPGRYLKLEQPPISAFNDNPVFDERGAAQILRLSPDQLKKWRQRDMGPDYMPSWRFLIPILSDQLEKRSETRNVAQRPLPLGSGTDPRSRHSRARPGLRGDRRCQ